MQLDINALIFVLLGALSGYGGFYLQYLLTNRIKISQDFHDKYITNGIDYVISCISLMEIKLSFPTAKALDLELDNNKITNFLAIFNDKMGQAVILLILFLSENITFDKNAKDHFISLINEYVIYLKEIRKELSVLRISRINQIYRIIDNDKYKSIKNRLIDKLQPILPKMDISFE